MPQVHSGNQLTIKPDVYDVLKGDIDLSETPIYNRLVKGPDSPDANLFRYGFDAPDNPTNTGAADGTEYSAATASIYGARANMHGRMQHYNEKFGVGELAQGNAVFNTDQNAEFQYQMKMGLKKCLRSAEYTLVGGQESQAGDDTTAHRTRGFERHLEDTAGIAVQTDTATQVPAAFRLVAGAKKSLTVTGTNYPLTEEDINDPFTAIWNAMKGRINLDVFTTPIFQRKVSLMSVLVPTPTDTTVVRRYNVNAADMKIMTVVKTYEGDCGTARFHLHPWLRFDPDTQKSEAIGLDFRYGCLRMRQAPKVEQLDKTSAARKGMILHTFGLQYVPKVAARWVRDESGS
jgi:hypothetical protein